MLSPEIVAALKAAVVDAARTHDRRADNFKRQVFNVVDHLKTAGLPPERIILMVRQLISETPASGHYLFVGEYVAAWCLERYYDQHVPDGPSDPI